MTTPLPERVAREIRAELGRQGMTQAALAAAIGKNENYVTRRIGVAKGETQEREAQTVVLDMADLESIAQALGVPVSRFLADAA